MLKMEIFPICLCGVLTDELIESIPMRRSKISTPFNCESRQDHTPPINFVAVVAPPNFSNFLAISDRTGATAICKSWVHLIQDWRAIGTNGWTRAEEDTHWSNWSNRSMWPKFLGRLPIPCSLFRSHPRVNTSTTCVVLMPSENWETIEKRIEDDRERPSLVQSTEHKFNFDHLTRFSPVRKLIVSNSPSSGFNFQFYSAF